jgi:glycosyltransferase involved in cell wall biosynthesis
MREVFVDGEDCLLVEPRSADSIAAAIQRLYCNPSLGKTIGANARSKVLRDFLVDSMVEKYLSAYDKCCQPVQ